MQTYLFTQELQEFSRTIGWKGIYKQAIYSVKINNKGDFKKIIKQFICNHLGLARQENQLL
jgi:hypothetical protein